MSGDIDLDFSGSPTTWRFLNDDSFVRGLMGPVGSGKSYGCAAEILLRAAKQRPSPIDRVRYSRFVIVRNSYPELRTTTIKTWQEIFPESVWGPMRWSPPVTHHLKLPAKGRTPGLDCEVIFLALDQPKDVRKLLSLELTGAWVNEARELPKAVIDGLTHRVGRYPTKAHGGATWRGIWMDTNPMDDDHWWFRLAEKEKIRGKFAWTFYKQPGGVIEADGAEVGSIQAAGKFWRTNPDAENLANLPAGYYEQQLAGKNLDWIRCYAGGQYTFVQEGRPFWPEFADTVMSIDDAPFEPSLPVQIGIDFGLTPAAVFGQRHPNGRWHVLHELVSDNLGLERFAQLLIWEVHNRFPKAEVLIWGDPAGAAREGIWEVTAFDHLKSLGLLARPAPSNDVSVRREAGASPMLRLIDGKPGLLVNRSCVRLRKSLAGGYCFKRVAMAGGQERFADKPNKNEHSHVGDAFSYLMSGGGEVRRITRNAMGSAAFRAPAIAVTDFDVI